MFLRLWSAAVTKPSQNRYIWKENALAPALFHEVRFNSPWPYLPVGRMNGAHQQDERLMKGEVPLKAGR